MRSRGRGRDRGRAKTFSAVLSRGRGRDRGRAKTFSAVRTFPTIATMPPFKKDITAVKTASSVPNPAHGTSM